MGKFSLREQASSDITKDDLTYEYDTHDNVAIDLVKYTRSNTVRNEQQFFLTTLGYLSGFMESPNHFVSGVLIGTAGSGKSHVQNKVAKLFDNEYLYEATTGSETSIIYDDTWEDAYIANLDELNKPSDKIIEILKSLHGGEDEEFRYKVTGDGQGADRDVDEIVRSAIPYWFLYAQYEPDFEMWDRLVKIPVHESKDKNEGVARTHWGHSKITFGDSDHNYIYNFDDGTKALKEHIRNMPKSAWVKIPAGEEEYGWDAFEHAKVIFDINRSETNRVSSQVANLVRCSALLNYENRDTRKITIRGEGTKEVIIAEPQDVANVLSCRDTLLATTHQLDEKRKAICVAIQKSGGPQQAASINKIQDFLRKTNSAFVKRSQIEAMLHDLEDNYLVEKLERAGENGRNLYQFQSWQSLGKFEINDEFKRVFKDCVDPFNGDDFIDTARKINDNLTPKASDFMGDGSEVTSSSDDDDGQQTLGGTPSEDIDVDLNHHEEVIRKMLKETLDGKVVDNLDESEPTPRQMLGIVPMDADDDNIDTEGTILDPENDVWSYGPDEWVETTNDAEQEIEKAIRRLVQEKIFKTSVTKSRGGQPLAMRVTVEDV